MAMPAFGQIREVELKADKKKVDEEKGRQGGNQTVTTKEIIYTISVTNKQFKPIPELQVKYMLFFASADAGVKEQAANNSQRGTETISNLAPNSTVNFDTKSIKLTTVDLDAGWYYTTGAGNRARDKANGIWVRAYNEGRLVAEYANPSTVSKKNTWKD